MELVDFLDDSVVSRRQDLPYAAVHAGADL
jgi:hypothetical protein